MKLPKFARLLLAPVLFWTGLLGFVMMVIGKRIKKASAKLNALEQTIKI